MDRRSLLAAGLAGAAFGWTGARAQDGEEQLFDPSQPRERIETFDDSYDTQDAYDEPAPSRSSAPSTRSAPLDEDEYDTAPDTPRHTATPDYPAAPAAETYSRSEMVNSVSDFMGVTAESAAAAIERIFQDNGQPTAYIAGEEGSAAFIGGLRYGKGLLYMKRRRPMRVYWRGPSIGFDWGGNASRNFTLCYDMQVPEMIFRRFPGVEGSAYLIGGLGVNYQRANGITLAPIRAGVGLRLGANVGYLAYSRRRNYFPF